MEKWSFYESGLKKRLFMAENILEPRGSGAGTFRRFYFGMLPTQWSHSPLLYPLTAAL